MHIEKFKPDWRQYFDKIGNGGIIRQDNKYFYTEVIFDNECNPLKHVLRIAVMDKNMYGLASFKVDSEYKLISSVSCGNLGQWIDMWFFMGGYMPEGLIKGFQICGVKLVDSTISALRDILISDIAKICEEISSQNEPT